MLKALHFLFVVTLMGWMTPMDAEAQSKDGPPPLLVHYTFDTHPNGGGDGDPIQESSLVADDSGNDRPARVIGGGLTWEEDGRVGGAFRFDGSLTYLQDHDAQDYLNGPTALSVSVWVKSKILVTDAGIITGDAPDDNDQNLSLRYDVDGKFGGASTVIKGGISTEEGVMEYESATGTQSSIWQHLVLIYESGEPLRLYINGERDAPSYQGGPVAGEMDGQTLLNIGLGAKLKTDTWEGLIDDVRIYDGVLTDEEVAELATGGVLPVELSGFTATTDGSDVLLEWTTASETNNSGFRIETRRAEDNAPWRRQAFVDGAGTTSRPASYRYRLRSLAPGAHQIRLVQVDFDGTEHVQPTRTVDVRPAQMNVAVAPNPIRGQAAVRLTMPDTQPTRVVMYNVLGQAVKTLHDGPLAAGAGHRFSLSTDGLPSGLYLVRVTTPTQTMTKRVTVVR